MELYEPNELASLFFGVIAAILIAYTLYRQRIPRFRYFTAGFAFILFANFFTVAEGFAWSSLLNTLEHICYSISGLLFLLAVRTFGKSSPAEDSARDAHTDI